MKVVMLRSGYGHPDSRFEKEVSTLLEAGHDVKIIAWDRTSNQDYKHLVDIFDSKVDCIHIGIRSDLAAGFKKNLFPMIRFNIKLIKYLFKLRKGYEIIHASDFDTIVPSIIAKRILNKKLIYDIYDYYSDSHHMPTLIKKVIKRLDTNIINKCDSVIVCNEKRKLQIQPACPKSLYVIHNSPSYNIISNIPNELSEKGKFRIVFIGGFAKKGRYIFEMINVIKKRNDCELVIGGFGDGEHEIEKESMSNDNIIYIGKQNYDNVLRIEWTADLMTALYDPTLENHRYAAPNKFYEAIMLGKPLICAKNTNIDEIVITQNLGWVLNIPEKSFEEEFDRVLDEAIYHFDEKNYQPSHAQELFKLQYSWDIMKDRLRNIYTEIQL